MLAITVGLPGSGKSTWAAKAQEAGWVDVIINPDKIREELTGDASDQSRNRDVWQLTYQRAEAWLQADCKVLIDATFLTPKARKEPLALVEVPTAVWFNTPVDVCFERNLNRDRVVPEHAMERMKAQWSQCRPATLLDEGYAVMNPQYLNVWSQLAQY